MGETKMNMRILCWISIFFLIPQLCSSMNEAQMGEHIRREFAHFMNGVVPYVLKVIKSLGTIFKNDVVPYLWDASKSAATAFSVMTIQQQIAAGVAIIITLLFIKFVFKKVYSGVVWTIKATVLGVIVSVIFAFGANAFQHLK